MSKNIAINSLVLYLLLSQFVTVAHALDHELAHEENEQCFICIHHSDLHNVLLHSPSVNEINTPAFEKTYYQNQGIYLAAFSLFRNRSPPITPL